jgi:hypothetical protein
MARDSSNNPSLETQAGLGELVEKSSRKSPQPAHSSRVNGICTGADLYIRR